MVFTPLVDISSSPSHHPLRRLRHLLQCRGQTPEAAGRGPCARLLLLHVLLVQGVRAVLLHLTDDRPLGVQPLL